MINRFTLIAITAALTLTGCAKITAATSAAKSSVSAVLTPAEAKIVDFSTGPTLVNVTHVATPADDGEPIYVTVDGIDAGILAIGQTVELHVSEGKHKIGGYARSLVGRVTIPAVEVTTEPHTKQHVNYAITRKTPKFTVGPSTKVIVSAPVAAATAPAATPAATTTPSTTATPAATTTPSTTTAPAVTTTPETTSTPAATTPTTTSTPATTSTPTTTSVPETTTPAATTTTE